MAGRPPARAASIPPPEAIAALVRREGPEEARLATLDHVMSCADCRRDFDLLRAVERAGVESGAAGARGGRRAWLHAGGARRVGPARGRRRPDGAALRRATTRPAATATRAVVLVPARPRGQAGDAAHLRLACRSPGASRYELELLDAGGGVALGGRPPTPRVARGRRRCRPATTAGGSAPPLPTPARSAPRSAPPPHRQVAAGQQDQAPPAASQPSGSRARRLAQRHPDERIAHHRERGPFARRRAAPDAPRAWPRAAPRPPARRAPARRRGRRTSRTVLRSPIRHCVAITDARAGLEQRRR